MSTEYKKYDDEMVVFVFCVLCTLLRKHDLNNQLIGANLEMCLNNEDQTLLK